MLVFHHFSFIVSSAKEAAIMNPKKMEYLTSRVEKNPVIPLVKTDGSLRTLAELESEVIKHAVKLKKGNICNVAKGLGIGRSTLYRKLQSG
jgi:DNA-binding NtrC family response regulator